MVSDFLSFFHSNDDDFYKLSFLKCDILSNHVSIKKRFKIDKLKISNSFKKIDSNYLNKIINIKSKSIDLKSVISIYDLFINIGKINSYRHLDFEKISIKSNFIQCKKCSLINVINNQNSKKNEKMFKSILYSKSKQTNQKNLCLAGGVALNCVANGKILKNLDINSLWIQPAAGDAGGSLGAALAFWHLELKKKEMLIILKTL